MTVWDRFTAQERVVMVAAIEESYLNGVIGDFLGHAEHGGAIWVSSNDADAIRALIPQFATIVLDMIERGLIEIREPHDGHWDSAPSLTPAETGAVLDDPRTWVWSADGDNRMVLLIPPDHADQLIGR